MVKGAGVGKVLAVVDVANEVSVVGVVTGVLVVVVGARIRNSCIKQLVYYQIPIDKASVSNSINSEIDHF